MKLNFRLLDKIILSYIILSIVYMIIGWGNVVSPIKNISILGIIAIFVIVISLLSDRITLFIILRRWYPLVVFGIFFEITTFANRVIFHDYLDYFFQHIDFLLFGYQPTMLWGQMLDNWFWQEFFHFAYFSYYLMIPGLAIYYYKRNHEQFNRYVFNLAIVFVACNLTYNILPVIGGRFWDSTLALTKVFRYGPFTRIMAFIYNNTEHWGGAFPSSHVAVSLTIMLSAFQQRLKISYLLLLDVICLSIATVYCHYHYFIDIIGGIIYGYLFFFLSNKIYSKRVQHV